MCYWSSFTFLETDINTFCRLVQWNLTNSWHFGFLVFIQMNKNYYMHGLGIIFHKYIHFT